MSSRSQAAIEFLVTYGWAIIILTIMIYLLYYFVTVPNSIVPSICSFNSDVFCTDIVIGTNTLAQNTILYMNITNLHRYPLANPQISMSLNGRNSTPLNCFPDFVPPGRSMLCTAIINVSTRIYQTVSGALYLNISDCGLIQNYTIYQNCTNPPSKIVVGSFIGHTEPYLNSSFTVGHIYCVGSEAQSPYNYSYYAPITSLGGFGKWNSTTGYPIPMEDAGCSIWSGYIYCVGSYNGVASVSSTYYAPISNNGIGNWIATTPYPLPMNESGCSIYNGYLFCVGTNSTYPFNFTYYAPVTSKGIGNWKSTTPYPEGTDTEGCSIYNGYMYCVDRGISSNPKNAFYATVSDRGIGQWTPAQQYPRSQANAGCTATGGYIYCVSTDVTKSSYFSALSKINGALLGWQSTTAYPLKFWDTGCITFSNRMYCMGNFFNANNRKLVYYAPISAAGFGGWVRGPDYPVNLYSAYCAIDGNSGGFFG